MRLKKYLKELSMKSGTKINYFKKTKDEFHAEIVIDSGGEEDEIFDIETNKTLKLPVNRFQMYAASSYYTDYEMEDYWKITIKRPKPITRKPTTWKEEGIDLWNISFEDKHGMIEITPKAKGVALKLFAAIEEFMKTFVKKYKPIAIKFSGDADEPSRIKLYNLLAKKMVKLAPYKLYRSSYSTGRYILVHDKYAG